MLTSSSDLEICLPVLPKEFPVVDIWLWIEPLLHPEGIVESGDWCWACLLTHSHGTTWGNCKINAGDLLLVRAAPAHLSEPSPET